MAGRVVSEDLFNLLTDATEKQLDSLHPVAAKVGKEALAAFRKHKDSVIGMAEESFVEMLDKSQNLSTMNEAELVYIKNQAEIDELINDMDRDTLGLYVDKKREEEARAKFWAMVGEITIAGLKILIPLMLAAL